MLPPRISATAAVLLALAACDKEPAAQTRGSRTPNSAPEAVDVPSAGDPSPHDAPSPPPDASPTAADPPPDPPPAPPPESSEPTFGPAELTKLTDEQLATLNIGDEDPPIPVEIHYIQSNEKRHDLFFPFIENHGGCLIGVGSDQSFTIAAKARSEFVFMMDIDTRIKDLHQMHRVFVLAAETPQEAVAFWERKNADTSAALLTKELAEAGLPPKRIKRILRGYRVGRETVFRHLVRVISRTRDGERVTWLSNPQDYAHIRALYQTDRLRIMQGNLAGGDSMRTAAAACEAMGSTMKVIYMSNAEEYFTYSADFVQNIAAQPIDDESVVLRTIYSKKWEHADLWAYQVHHLADFNTRLQDRRNRKRSAMLRYAKKDGGLERESLAIEGFSRIGFNDVDPAAAAQ